MTWGPGFSLAAGSKTANLVEFHVLGTSDAESGKNLKTGSPLTAARSGAAGYGSDAIGTYLECVGAGDYLTIANSGIGFPGDTGATSVVMFVLSRTGTVGDYAYFGYQEGRFTLNPDPAPATTTTVGGGSGWTVAYNFRAVSTNTEIALIVDFDNGSFYYTGGGGALTFPSQYLANGTLGALRLGNSDNGNSPLSNTRIYAYARWSSASGISGSDWQSIADNPQQLVTAGGAGAPGTLLMLGAG